MKQLFSLILMTMTQLLQAQNLVPNPSFEDENICERHQPCSPAAWFYTTQHLAAGYFINEIPAATGKRWLNIVVGNKANKGGRQYWETMLLSPLVKGASYKVSISVHGWDTGPYVQDVGINFMQQLSFYKNDTILQPAGYLQFDDAKVTNLKNGWFRLEKKFIADNATQCIMIGNFSSRDYQDIAKQRFSKSIYIGSLIDDLVIEPVERIDCQGCQQVKDSLYSLVNRHSSAATVLRQQSDQENSTKTLQDTLLLNDIYFDFASYKIANPASLENYRDKLDSATIMKVKVVGYTDTIGSIRANKNLSLKRAKEVANVLTTRFGIPAANIETIGYGVSKDNGDNKKARRVEMYIYRK